jgi:hypothetical protein
MGRARLALTRAADHRPHTSETVLRCRDRTPPQAQRRDPGAQARRSRFGHFVSSASTLPAARRRQVILGELLSANRFLVFLATCPKWRPKPLKKLDECQAKS